MKAAPWTFAEPWGASGWVSDLGGPVHWIDFGGEGDGAPIVFVHGLGGSHLNWALVGTALAKGRRAVALDLRGFGMTPGAPRSTSIRSNVSLVDAFIREVVGGPAVLVGNSMGGVISVLQAHNSPHSVAGLVLVDPALPPATIRPDLRVAAMFMTYMTPGIGELYMRFAQNRLSSRQLVRRMNELCFADPSRLDPKLMDASVALTDQRREIPRKEESFLGATRSLMRFLARPDRYRDIMAGLKPPVLLISGDADRLVPITLARAVAKANPHWDTAFMTDVGHTPQLETPAAVVNAVTDWLARTPTTAGK
ncbi:alpha/beta fold hydrolase [Kutzneria buriramensis]|uniref:Pimeloyl-ACP methyl ester carboxylesterase n=1 Tax=Kutzneria buriramensis TaxID=1045776 RepID=A0A3E0H212_9PSEU|nr:alpha/beta hydrolase [Kutzneria buriramensis]REH37142.1 pimeloyl-ACP methyl ester carboxylesterase [Kutzneria buriramensis]